MTLETRQPQPSDALLFGTTAEWEVVESALADYPVIARIAAKLAYMRARYIERWSHNLALKLALRAADNALKELPL